MGYTLFIDESGSISLNNGEKYFTIGGYLIKSDNKNEHKFKMKKIIKKINKNRDIYFNYHALEKELNEVKFSNLSFEGRKFALNELNKLSGTFISIVVDKENCHSLTKCDTNEYYNYLVYQLIKYVFETCNFHGDLDFDELNIIYDDRSMKVKARNNLQAYLIEKLKIQRSIRNQFSCNFNLKAADSKVNYGVMISDFIAGLSRSLYMKPKNPINNLLNIDYISKFPYKDFGKAKKIQKYIDNNADIIYNVVNS
ncbi:DUF3800 domain-containing protein [Clostridium perfringens]|uniref:DUF3800 domain-containing protein n=1 Tax=Clostridium perfringens TaxID=1502 RepID=UPI000BC067E0|nr:DUF3800 domain-containing protein [Clostridium perfringens]ASY50140.1 hypothetical protein BG908_00180 [Clostridium perfringens]AWS24619.1 hypothetical protein CYK96_03000 [Clostridium perfringens]